MPDVPGLDRLQVPEDVLPQRLLTIFERPAPGNEAEIEAVRIPPAVTLDGIATEDDRLDATVRPLHD
jgi:hypothetical protein